MEETEESKLDELINHGEEYFKTRQELSKLIAIQKTSVVAAGLFSSMILFFLFFFVVVFASIALAYLISLYTGKVYLGFLSIAGLYFIAGIIFYAKRKSVLEEPMINAIIKNFNKSDSHE